MKDSKISLFVLWLAVLLAAVLMTGCASQASIAEVKATDTPPVVAVEPTAAPTPVPPTAAPSPTVKPKADWTSYTAVPNAEVQYVDDGARRHRLDVYLPKEGEGPFPTVLAIHGGGFQAESKYNYSRYASYFTSLGYALVATNYRFVPMNTYPAQVQDAFCALAWIHANAATYGFDTEHIAAIGESAGGYLVAMLGTVDDPTPYLEGCPSALPEKDWIQGVIPIYGLFDYTNLTDYPEAGVQGCLEPYLGTTIGEASADFLKEVSPISWVNGNEPPFLITYALSDTLIPMQASEAFAAKLEEAGGDVTLKLMEAWHGHFTDDPLTTDANVQTQEAIAAFLTKVFGK